MDELIPLLAIFFALGVPAMSLATHFVLRPLVKDIVEALRSGSSDDLTVLERRVGELETRLARQDVELVRLTDAEAFRKRLEESA